MSLSRDPVSRRAVIGGLAGFVGLSALGLAACGSGDDADARAEPDRAGPGPSAGTGVRRRGVCYDVGTSYGPGHLSRRVWRDDLVVDDLAAIATRLHADSIILFGSEIDRLRECSALARRHGLHVWISPRLVGATPEATRAHLVASAEVAEEVRQAHDEVGFITGCELTVFMAGLVAGDTLEARAASLGDGAYQERLGEYLSGVQGSVREVFGGEVTYSAGTWEDVDWSGYDVVGLNHYRGSFNRATYVDDLRRSFRHGKPVVITEFGCATHRGAEDKGGDGDDVVDWTTPVPTVTEGIVRDEQVQADTIVELLDIFAAEGVDSAYVFQFIEPDYPHSPDPRFDLDTASYALVRVGADGSGLEYGTAPWEPKLAFTAIAAAYA